MNHYQLHDTATELAAERTAYSLAREVPPATAIDPRDYAIIRALGALCLATPNVELAQAFLRSAGADRNIHHSAQVRRCQQVLAQGKAQRISDQTIEINFPSCRLAGEFEQLATATEEPQK